LARALSKLGVSSRSQARLIIDQGRVRVNGCVVKDPELWIDPRSDRILVDEVRIASTPVRWIMLHKPTGVVTTRSDERGRGTVFDLLGEAGRGLKAVGRLDLDTSGLLLLTTDSRSADALTDPRRAVPKRYSVISDRPLSTEALANLRSGVDIRLAGKRYRTKPAVVSLEAACSCEIVITEGKNRQLRRMFEAVGCKIVSLRRAGFGVLQLGDLPAGSWRELNNEEVEGLHELAGTRRRARS
jgi:pseudouridine synthase